MAPEVQEYLPGSFQELKIYVREHFSSEDPKVFFYSLEMCIENMAIGHASNDDAFARRLRHAAEYFSAVLAVLDKYLHPSQRDQVHKVLYRDLGKSLPW